MRWTLGMVVVLLLLCGVARAQVDFTDNFNAGASPLWGNQSGSWTATGGVYSAQLPSNNPTTYTSLPFALTDFAANVDIVNVKDGGLWLRSSIAGGVRNGVLLVTGGNLGAGTGLYWHVVTDGLFSPNLNEVSGLFTSGVSDPHIRVEVTGDTYAAFVDASATPATTLTTANFTSGEFGLYDFSSQTFDNVRLITAESMEDADFDADGDVDGADFLTWQRGVGTTAGGLRADGNANPSIDGDVDDDDLAVWINQFGDVTAMVSVVPESRGIALWLLAGMGLLWKARLYCV